jgi:hypothetical protein
MTASKSLVRDFTLKGGCYNNDFDGNRAGVVRTATLSLTLTVSSFLFPLFRYSHFYTDDIKMLNAALSKGPIFPVIKLSQTIV